MAKLRDSSRPGPPTAGPELLTRQALREELAAFSATLTQPPPSPVVGRTERSDAQLQVLICDAVLNALAKSHDLTGEKEHLTHLPNIHPWLKSKPLRHDDIGEEEKKSKVSRHDHNFAMKQVHHRHSSTSQGLRDLRLLEGEDGPGNDGGYEYTAMNNRNSSHQHLFPDLECSGRLVMFVRSALFEEIMLLLLCMNAILVGVETYYMKTDSCGSGPALDICDYFGFIQTSFIMVFLMELTLRIWADGLSFFYREGWQLNIFDAVVIVLVCVDQAVRTFDGNAISHSNLNILRLLRLFRIARLLRVVRVADEFQRMLGSIVSSLTSLCWVFVLLGALIYFFSVFFTQLSIDYGQRDHPDYPALMHRFGSIHASGLSLFEAIFGGISWDEDAQLLINCISPVAAIVLCAYIFFCYTALMNLITGVFVDKALRAAMQAEELNLCNTVANLFFTNADQQISWDIFQSKLKEPGMQDYLKAVDISPTEAENLFALLDTDNSGGIDVAEIVNGLLRLKGSAGALEMSLLLREMSHLCDRLEHRLCIRFGNYVEDEDTGEGEGYEV
eukprot:TRINITY_DN20014_c0_g1_i3.p1 TRINITY_DN20014_c0_g1~~TRINITY_DN20014_c0_g1_i3.p1  ORF type:complete len:559 (-),score=88.24 TRINITY_DN20014_c0_g1_i3:372-2048(-)